MRNETGDDWLSNQLGELQKTKPAVPPKVASRNNHCELRRPLNPVTLRRDEFSETRDDSDIRAMLERQGVLRMEAA